MAWRLTRRRPGGTAATVNLGVNATVISVLVTLPLLFLVFGALRSGPPGTAARFTAANFAFLGTAEFADLLLRSVLIAAGATAVAIIAGGVLAALSVRVALIGGRVVEALIVVPAYITPFIGALAWTLLLSPRVGYGNKLLDSLGLPTVNIYSHAGIIWVMGLYFAPIAFLYFRPALQGIDSSLEESARVLGASPAVVARRILAPLLLPALLSSVLVVFVSAIGQFAVPGVLGPPANIEVLTTQIVRMTTQFPSDPNGAAVIGLALLVLTVVALWAGNRILRRRDYTTVDVRGGGIPKSRDTGARIVGSVLAWGYVLIAVLLPLAVMLLASLQPYLTTDLTSVGLTFENYQRVFDFPKFTRSIVNSVQLAIGAAAVCAVLSIFIGHLIVRSRPRGHGYVEQLSTSSIAIPHTVFGVAVLWTWVSLPVGVYGTPWILLLTYVALFLPFCVRPVVAAFHQLDVGLEESARVLGARWLTALRKVVVPLMLPAVISGALIVLYHAVRELAASVMLYTVGNEVIAVAIWELYGEGKYVELFALGAILVGLNITMVIAAQLVFRRFERGRTG